MLPRNALRPMLLVTGLICLLGLLAALQYRWSGQVSEAERLRMQASLQIAVDQFRQDFARELLSVAAGLQPDLEQSEPADWKLVAEAQAEWLASAQNAHLVSAVYLVLAGEKQSLLRLDAAHGKFAAAPVPANMQSLVERWEGPFDERRPGLARLPAWIMDGSGPFLIRGLFSARRPLGREERGPPPERRLGVQVIALNREYLTAKLLPELAARHFGGSDGFVYQVRIFTASPAITAIYDSSGAPGAPPGVADIATDLIEMRPRGGLGGGPDRGPRDRPFGFRGRPRREGPGMFSRERAFNMPLLISDGNAPWKLAVRHRSGSVATAVQSLRWRNLTVSFVILLVLGVSMATIVRNTQRAQRLAELQMEFVAGISHELRTPLAVISSAAENLTDGIVEDAGQVKQYGSLIRNESRRLNGMMEQILQFAAGQKRKPYKPVLLPVEELIEAALSLSRMNLEERGFTIERGIARSLPPVSGEGGALTQCLQNLISNAAKYSGTSRWIGIFASAESGWISITVEDRGIGIEKGDLPHLFDAFFRAKAVRSEQIHGTGLGLNLARSFARDAGGEIQVQSTVGQGSRFTLRLPAADLAPPGEPARLIGRSV